CPEFRIGERELPKAYPILAGCSQRWRRIRAVQDAAQTKLANAGRNQLTLFVPLADTGDAGNIKVNALHSPVVLRDRIYEHEERLVDGWVIVAAGSGKMRDLHRNARRSGQKLRQEHARLLRAVWALPGYRRPHVNHNGHPAPIRFTEDLPQSLH